MYISEINIENFRNFEGVNNIIKFNEGTNIIIGHNNSGKSNLLKALDLVLNTGSSKSLSIDDFNKNISIEKLKEKSPKVSITLTFNESTNEAEFSDDLVTVSTWLTRLEEPYQAQLTYVFYLPETEEEEYKTIMNDMNSDSIDDIWDTIEHKFLRKYKYRIYGGDPELKQTADFDSLRNIDFQFLDAIRDVERDLLTGKNTLLREVIDFFMDYDIKNNTDLDKMEQQKRIDDLKWEFSDQAKGLVDSLKYRMENGKKEMLSYAQETGASFDNAEPDFEGRISDSELYSALKLIVRYETNIKIPVTHNGSGYNNLIYISLLLAKMQKDASGDYLGSNAKVFPVLAIEEPEAHLHPAMQYKFLKFLTRDQNEKVRQVFVTTHSPNITAAVKLDNIISLHRRKDDSLNISYPGQTFGFNTKHKNQVERFLDVTKSDMLFADRVILVEGITEQLLIPQLADYLGYDLEAKHISIINVGGRHFEHFLQLFDETKENTIHKKVAIITDLDPTRKKINPKYDKNKGHKKCYPFELDLDKQTYEYQYYSNSLIDDYKSMSKDHNIAVFSQKPGVGKTLEYSLAYENPGLYLLLINSISNYDNLEALFDAYNNNHVTLQDMTKIISTGNCDENDRIAEEILNYQKADIKDDSKRHLIAAKYLQSYDKGENAYELAEVLANNLTNGSDFQVPKYIKDAIEWICN